MTVHIFSRNKILALLSLGGMNINGKYRRPKLVYIRMLCELSISEKVLKHFFTRGKLQDNRASHKHNIS